MKLFPNLLLASLFLFAALAGLPLLWRRQRYRWMFWLPLLTVSVASLMIWPAT